MDFNNAKKILPEVWGVNHNAQFIFVGFKSGSDTAAYVITPASAKLMLKALGDRVKAYEEKFGTIDTNTDEVGIVSPFLQKD